MRRHDARSRRARRLPTASSATRRLGVELRCRRSGSQLRERLRRAVSAEPVRPRARSSRRTRRRRASDPRLERDLGSPREPVRVAGAVPALVVVEDRRQRAACEVVERCDASERPRRGCAADLRAARPAVERPGLRGAPRVGPRACRRRGATPPSRSVVESASPPSRAPSRHAPRRRRRHPRRVAAAGTGRAPRARRRRSARDTSPLRARDSTVERRVPASGARALEFARVSRGSPSPRERCRASAAWRSCPRRSASSRRRLRVAVERGAGAAAGFPDDDVRGGRRDAGRPARAARRRRRGRAGQPADAPPRSTQLAPGHGAGRLPPAADRPRGDRAARRARRGRVRDGVDPAHHAGAVDGRALLAGDRRRATRRRCSRPTGCRSSSRC